MVGDAVAAAGLVQHAVYPLGGVSFESIAAQQIQQWTHSISNLVELGGTQQIRQDHVSIAQDGGQVRLGYGGVDLFAAAAGPTVRTGQVTGQLCQRCHFSAHVAPTET